MAIDRTSTIDTVSNDVCLGPNREVMVKRGEIVLGDSGQASGSYEQFRISGQKRAVVVYDDFVRSAQALSTTAVDGWRSTKGTTNTVDFTITPAVNGTIVGTMGDTTASMAAAGVQLDHGLNWKANQGNLWFEARVKTSIITNINLFIGFTDQVSALEAPASLSVTTFTTNATDAVGFLFDTEATTDTIRLVGVANNVDATHQDTSTAPAADTYAVYRIELTSAGVASFFINGAQVGTALSGAVTATVALTPVIAGFNRTTTGNPTITVDYIYVSADRA